MSYVITSPASPRRSRSDDSDESPPDPSGRKKTLSIVSHNRHVALSPAPDLHYDLRVIPNPPVRDRKRHTGHSKTIQDGLMQEPRYCALLEAAEADIRGAMKTVAGKEDRGDEDITLRVGCLCGSGHHRSVAFSEQLAMVEWPGDWQLELTHRDVTLDVKRRKAIERRK